MYCIYNTRSECSTAELQGTDNMNSCFPHVLVRMFSLLVHIPSTLLRTANQIMLSIGLC